MQNVLYASPLSLYDVSRSQPRLAPTHARTAQQPIGPDSMQQHHRTQLFCGSKHFGQRRSSKLVSRDSASSSTWPSESAEASNSADAPQEGLPSQSGNGAAKKDIEISTDEAATRVGLSSKGSKKLAGFWGAYSKALEEHPIRVKSATSFFGFLAGDAVAQLIVGAPYNYFRTLRMVIFGILMDGPIGKWPS